MKTNPSLQAVSAAPLIAAAKQLDVSLAPTDITLISGLNGDLCFTDENCSQEGVNRTCVDSQAAIFNDSFANCPGPGHFCFCFGLSFCKSDEDCSSGELCLLTRNGLECSSLFFAAFLPSASEVEQSAEPSPSEEFVIIE